MESAPMSVTVMLTGLLPFVVLAGSLLALPCCWGLLRLYRRSVTSAMRTSAAHATASSAGGARRSAPQRALDIQLMDPLTPVEPTRLEQSAWRLARRGPWRTAVVYAAAGGAYAAVMTAGWLLATRDAEIGWIKVAIIGWTYLWPAVLTTLLVAADTPSRRMQVLGSYFAAFALFTGVALSRNPDMGVASLPVYWLIQNAAPTVLLLTFLLRPIRAVGPLVLAFLIAVAIGSQAVLIAAAANSDALRAVSEAGFRLGLGAGGVFLGMMLTGMVLAALLAWPALRWLGRRYERKRSSDQSITVDSLWLLFGVVQSIGLAFEGPLWIFTGPVAFVSYKIVAATGWRISARGSIAAPPYTLLLLRVFALGKRSERLFVRLRNQWQYAGSISMIAGPDLVTTTVEPHEFLDFLTGRLSRQFVQDADDLERRLKVMDHAPDHDGRYRVNEFFCRDNTWQMTMERLAGSSRAVLMDLRGFSPSNQGCIFELGRLLDGVDLRRVVLLVDDTTDRGFLESTLQRLWSDTSPHSPNRMVASPAARLFRMHGRSDHELPALLRLLFERVGDKRPAVSV